MNEPIIAQREVTRHILSSFGIRTQKKLGQHFLVDEAVVSAIATALELQPGMPVLEIGPGIGTLTLRSQWSVRAARRPLSVACC